MKEKEIEFQAEAISRGILKALGTILLWFFIGIIGMTFIIFIINLIFNV